MDLFQCCPLERAARIGMTLSPRNEEPPQQRTMVGTHHCQPLLCNKEVAAIICYKKTFPRLAFHIFQRSVWQQHTSSLRCSRCFQVVLSPKSDWCFLLLTHMVSKHKISQTYSSCVFIQLYFHAWGWGWAGVSFLGLLPVYQRTTIALASNKNF